MGSKIKSICNGTIISVHYDYVKIFIEKTDDFKTGMSNALVWSYIIQSAWNNGIIEKEIKTDVDVIKKIFGVSNYFVDSLFDTLKVCGIISSYKKDDGSIVFCLNSCIDEEQENKVNLSIKKKIVTEYTDDFLKAFEAYPKRKTAHAKKTAFAAWQGRIKDGLTEKELISAAKNYCNESEEEGNIGTNFILMMSTFFGPNERYTPYLDKEDITTKSEFLSDHTKTTQSNVSTMKGVHLLEDNTAKEKRMEIFNKKFNKKPETKNHGF